MKYTVIKSEYSEKPYFCVTATGLRILNLLAKLESYALCEYRGSKDDIPLNEFLETERWKEFFIDYGEYWSVLFSATVEEVEEPVEAWYGDDDLIDFYASGKVELSDLILLEYFNFPEDPRPEPKPLVVQDTRFQYTPWIVFAIIILAVILV